MSLILSIETATSVCSVCLSDNEKVIALRETSEHNSHSRVIAVFIDEIFKETGIPKTRIDAVAVSRGPGSYTGLRIGVSTAKGLCYGLDKPLIAVDTLHSMAWGMRAVHTMRDADKPALFVPMIDARRMEVYTAVFDEALNMIKPVTAEIIDAGSFGELTPSHRLIFAGDGADKCREVLSSDTFIFSNKFVHSATHMVTPALIRFNEGLFEDTAYFEPFYLKDFIAGKPTVKGLN